MVLRVLGDSHSLWSYAGIEEARIYWRGPRTMHRAARDGIESLVPWWLRFKADDYLILSFGDIDARVHIPRLAKLNGRTELQEVELLCDRFQTALDEFRSRCPATIAVSCLIPFPPDYDGDHGKQREIRNRMNERLSSLGVPFIDYRAAFDAGDGTIRKDLWDQTVHILPSAARPVAIAVEHALGIKTTPAEIPARLKARAEPRRIFGYAFRFLKMQG